MDRSGELTELEAVELSALIHGGEVSAVEVMNATYDRLESINPTINAVVNALDRSAAIGLAEQADGRFRTNGPDGPFHGFPMAPKDSAEVTGFPTTRGFVPYASAVASSDDSMVARLRDAGGLFVGKTNMPEFGLGSHTFNELFGVTRNPYDPAVSSGGSSGGAAAALAARILAVADGGDMGGSLRNPASFCNVVGLRPSIGRVPGVQGFGWLARMSTSGPMARTVADAAMLLSVQAGPLASDPLSLPEPGEAFRSIPELDPRELRIAWSPNLGLPVEPEVERVVTDAAQVFRSIGGQVESAHPDLSGAMDVFQAQRAATLGALGDALDRSMPDWRDYAKDTAIWNIDQGRELSVAALVQSELRRTSIYRRIVAFFEDHDALVIPAAQVLPFPVESDWIRSINGVEMPTYLDWMTVCCVISVTGLPTISVPAGFSDSGLPVGLQIVGKPHGDLELLGIAQLFEQATNHYRRRPGDAS